nr:hypothetical protein [Tanacetum cinerariifolium]
MKPNQPEEPSFIAHILAICNTAKPVVFKAPITSSKAESVSQGAKPGAQIGHKKPLTSLKQPSVSNKEATKGGSSKVPTGSKTGYSRKRKESSSAMDSNLSQPSVSTLIDTELHKEDQQVTGGPTSLGVTNEERANPQLSSRASSTTINGDKEEASSTIKLEDLAKLDSPEDDPIIIVDESDEDEPNAETNDISVPRSSSPSSLPTELKDLPSKFTKLSEEVKGLKRQVHELLIELPKELKEIPTTLEAFKMAVTSLTSQVAKLKTLYSSQPKGEDIKKDKGKKVLSSEEAKKKSTKSDTDDEAHVTSSMVESSNTKKLNKFNFITKEGEHIHLTEEQINHQNKLKEEAKDEAAKQEGESRKAKAKSRITDCDVLTKKGPITLKVYRKDGTSKVIPNLKASDLHLGEWREVVKACPNRKGKG